MAFQLGIEKIRGGRPLGAARIDSGNKKKEELTTTFHVSTPRKELGESVLSRRRLSKTPKKKKWKGKRPE